MIIKQAGNTSAKMEANNKVLKGPLAENPAATSKDSDSFKEFLCKECYNRKFETISKLKYHRLKNHGKWLAKSFKCSGCDKSYGTNSNLKKHQKFVCGKTVQNKIVCPDCNYTTHDLYNMKVHQRKHTGERPYICTLCNYGFYKASDQKLHQKSCKGKLFDIFYDCSKRNNIKQNVISGLQLNCPHCETSFHFRTKLNHHLTWSETCGSVRDKVGEATNQSDAPMIRLNTEKVSVIAFNCNELLDKNIFVERKKKSKCGKSSLKIIFKYGMGINYLHSVLNHLLYI